MYQIGHECELVETSQREFRSRLERRSHSVGRPASTKTIDQWRQNSTGRDQLVVFDGGLFTCGRSRRWRVVAGARHGHHQRFDCRPSSRVAWDWELPPAGAGGDRAGKVDGMTKLPVRLDGPIIFMD